MWPFTVGGIENSGRCEGFLAGESGLLQSGPRHADHSAPVVIGEQVFGTHLDATHLSLGIFYSSDGAKKVLVSIEMSTDSPQELADPSQDTGVQVFAKQATPGAYRKTFDFINKNGTLSQLSRLIYLSSLVGRCVQCLSFNTGVKSRLSHPTNRESKCPVSKFSFDFRSSVQVKMTIFQLKCLAAMFVLSSLVSEPFSYFY
jgi:hypothetical protein